MSNKAIQQAMTALGIKSNSLYEMADDDRARVRHHVSSRSGVELQDDIFLHNDTPFAEGMAGWKKIDKLVFRGSGKSYDSIGNGFAAVPDQRFNKPCIIRDKWAAKRVTTHMQTKAVLAWSKSFYVALEYAYGCIKGGIGGEIPGYLHFCFVERGLDVLEAVRTWEAENRDLFSGAIDQGKQHEIVTPTVPRQHILATWELRKPRIIDKYGAFYVHSKTLHAGNFASVINAYMAISDVIPEGPGRAYEYPALGAFIDRRILI
jgi:hypothetical protein